MSSASIRVEESSQHVKLRLLFSILGGLGIEIRTSRFIDEGDLYFILLPNMPKASRHLVSVSAPQVLCHGSAFRNVRAKIFD